MTKKTIRIKYDCAHCPGYCCSYPRIAVSDSDMERLARHFNIDVEEAGRRFTRRFRMDGEVERILRHQKDETYGSICRFFDTAARRCTVYEARPEVCSEYPNGSRCGYYDFLKFERKHQGDQEFVPLT